MAKTPTHTAPHRHREDPEKKAEMTSVERSEAMNKGDPSEPVDTSKVQEPHPGYALGNILETLVGLKNNLPADGEMSRLQVDNLDKALGDLIRQYGGDVQVKKITRNA